MPSKTSRAFRTRNRGSNLKMQQDRQQSQFTYLRPLRTRYGSAVSLAKALQCEAKGHDGLLYSHVHFRRLFDHERWNQCQRHCWRHVKKRPSKGNHATTLNGLRSSTQVFSGPVDRGVWLINLSSHSSLDAGQADRLEIETFPYQKALTNREGRLCGCLECRTGQSQYKRCTLGHSAMRCSCCHASRESLKAAPFSLQGNKNTSQTVWGGRSWSRKNILI